MAPLFQQYACKSFLEKSRPFNFSSLVISPSLTLRRSENMLLTFDLLCRIPLSVDPLSYRTPIPTMAVIPDLLGLEITVCVNGTPLTEYEDDEPRGQAFPVTREGIPAGKSISKYIKSETDREFAFGLKISSPFKLDCPSLGFSLLIDDMRVAKTIFRGSYNGLDKPWSCFMEGIRVGPARTLMPLKFSKIETCEPPSATYQGPPPRFIHQS
jgi:hypothetical protein